MIYIILLSVIAGALGIYYYLLKDLNFFKKHGIPHKTPLPLLGNMGSMFLRRESMAELVKSIYDLSPDAKYVGMYDMNKPIIVLRDPELIKSIALKHFDMFMDHRGFIDETEDKFFGNNLFILRGDKWREVRSVLTPAFTSSKMKGMFKLMSNYGADFVNYLTQLPAEKRTIELKDVLGRYTSDVIATCAFGVSVDSIRNPENEFYVSGKELIAAGKTVILKAYMLRYLPWVAQIIGMTLFPEKITNFFLDLVKTTIKNRDENGIVRPDMLQLMMENRGKEGKIELTIDEMVAQAFLFFFGGFDGTSTLMCYVAHEIAVNQDIQEKLQNEIDEVLEKTNGQAPYEAINSMEYLDALIEEALRKYPVGLMLDRLCLKDFELPPTLPGKKPFTIRKGQAIWVPVYGLHHDPRYFEEPEKFDPERFRGERKKNSLNCGAYLPFGLGPRMCIGNRFALLETKVLIFHLLARCDLKPCEKTSIPLKISKEFNLKPEGGFWMNMSPRKNIHHTIATNVNGTYYRFMMLQIQKMASYYCIKNYINMVYIIALSVIVGALGIYYLINDLNFFKKHGIPYKTPFPLLGNMAGSFFRRESMVDLVKNTYNLHPEAKYVGMFDMRIPVVVIRDPDLIKSIALKNFDLFPDHRTFLEENQEPLFGKNLFSLKGERWRQVRSLLSPAFTSSKMKSMFKLMSDCAAEFSNYLAQMPEEKRVMEMKEVFTRYTNDVIATCAFGISVDSMRNPENEFYVYGKEVTNFNIIFFWKFFIIRSMPWLARIIRLKFFPEKIVNFFRDLIKTTIKTRDENGIVRPDMLQLMMENRGKDNKTELTIDDMVAQAFIFFFGGFDSSSQLMCFAAHEIAINQDIQEKLQNEIDEVLKKTNGQAPYEAINSMEYLNAVIDEALRKYPIGLMADRLCLKDFELPPTLPGMKPFTVKKGHTIWIPIYGLHHDPQYFEEPEKFDPERFRGERKRDSLNCGAYVPFGLGPRMCIGNRFALLETKVLLFHLLARCDLKPCEKTSIPLKIAKGSFNLKPEEGFWLNVSTRKNSHHTIAVNVVNAKPVIHI
ncbi:uncharacterized protein [Anoplolepis gracilipes]|uniref:uncharacterized protein n=1 Tax=Anoplolepis gracilipes TaxID=354296 RepID=UPI003BA3549D